MSEADEESETPDERKGRKGFRVIGDAMRRRVPSDDELKALIDEMKRHQKKAAELLGDRDGTPDAA